MGTSRRTGIFIPVKLLNNPLPSSSLRNFNFQLRHTTNFDKSTTLRVLVLATLELLLSVFFLQYKQQDNTVLYIV